MGDPLDGQTASGFHKRMLVENRLLHLREHERGAKTKVLLLGSKSKTTGLLEEIPGDDWHDNATRAPCPACDEFMPLGMLECLNWTCKAAIFYIQHRFTSRTEKVIIPRVFKRKIRHGMPERERHDNLEGASASAQLPEAEDGYRNDMRAAAARVQDNVNNFVARGNRYSRTYQVSAEKQFYKFVQREIVHIVKHEDYKNWCPFGFSDENHASYMYP